MAGVFTLLAYTIVYSYTYTAPQHCELPLQCYNVNAQVEPILTNSDSAELGEQDEATTTVARSVSDIH